MKQQPNENFEKEASKIVQAEHAANGQSRLNSAVQITQVK